MKKSNSFLMMLLLLLATILSSSHAFAAIGVGLPPSTNLSPDIQWEADMMVFNNSERYTSNAHNQVIGIPPSDASGSEWYATNYQLTNSEKSWSVARSPFSSDAIYNGKPSTQWTTEGIMADIYLRRTFIVNHELSNRILFSCSHDDAPAEWYLNGVLIRSIDDGWDFDDETYLTPEQCALIHTDGTKNVLAIHVHNNYGDALADGGLYDGLGDSNIAERGLPVSTVVSPDKQWMADMMVFNGERYASDVKPLYSYSNQIIGTPPSDAQGNEWYAKNYQLTDGEKSWSVGKSPFYSYATYNGKPSTQWTSDWYMADIYLRRYFIVDYELSEKIMFSCSHDDAPAEWYLNGVLIRSIEDGCDHHDEDYLSWTENESTYLTPEQRALIYTDGRVNVLAIHVHNNWGVGLADGGFYDDLNYSISPTGWTDVPVADLYQGSRTYQGGLLQAKATVSGRTATFMLKKNDGSQFQNRGHIVVHSGSIDGTIVKSNVSFEAGISNPTVNVDLDFTSGRRKYVIIIKDGDQYYYTKPIAITANGLSSDTDLVISGGSYFNTPILTTGKEFPFNIEIKNNGSKTWSGSFYLKCGREEWLRWDNVKISAGGIKRWNKSYTPSSSGRKTLTFYYQTGGSGSSMEVDGGDYDNPFTITVADPPSSDKLATPDKNTFTATNPTETGFTASWGAVDGALYYDINVRKVGGDYASAVFKGGSSTTSIKVTGLEPSTSYQFQIRARNDNNSQNSDWSASIPEAVTTKKAGTEPANLSIHAVRGFDGTTPLTVGAASTYKVYVVNNGTSDWYGSFYLKDGDINLKAWHNIALMSDAKAVQPLDFDYVPESEGEKALTLYYQTNTTGGGRLVNAGNGINPMTVQVSPDPSAYDGLTLKSAIVYPETLELGQTGTISAEVQNTGETECVIFLTDNHITISDQVTISAGQTRTIRTMTWEPQIAGAHTIAVEYRPKNSTKHNLVDASVFTNPVSVLVSNKDVLSDASKVIITHLTKSIVPNEVTPGSIVYYHFRLLDEKGKRLRGMKLKFTRENWTSARDEESEPSDDEGYAVLSLQTEGSASIGIRGETISYKCTTAINEAGKSIPVSGKSSDDTTVSLTIHDTNLFSEGKGLENVGKASFTLGVGLSGKADWKKLKGKVSGDAKTTFGIKFGNDGEIEEYSIDGGFYGGISGSLEESRSFLRELGIDDGTATYWSSLLTPNAINLGAKANVRWGSTTSNVKDLLVRTIMSYVDSYTEGTSEAQDFIVKALRYWYAKERKDSYSWNWSYGGSAAVSFQLLNTWPGKSWARPLVMPIVRYADLGLTFGASYAVEPLKEKDTWNSTYEDYYRTGNGGTSWGDESFSHEHLSGSSSSLSLSGTFDAKFELGKLCERAKSWINTDLMHNFQSKKLGETYPSVSYSYDKTFTLKHEEMFNDADLLREVSQSVAISSGHEISANKVELFGWNPGDYSFGISNKTTNKISSKGDWATFLARVSVPDGSDSYLKQLLQGLGWSSKNADNYRQQVFKVFPNLARNTLICSPAEIYNAWINDNDDYAKPLSILASITPKPQDYDIKEALKIEETITSELDMNVKIKVFDFGSAKFSFDTGVTLGIDNKPSNVSYFSLPDRRFFTVVQRPSISIEQAKDWLLDFITRKTAEAFMENKDGILNIVQWLNDGLDLVADKTSWIWDNAAGDFVEDWILYPIARISMSDRNNAIARHAMLRHPKLAEIEQKDICKFSIGLNKNIQNFNTGVKVNLSHHYPAGDLLGLTELGDTLFVVSDVIHIRAFQDADTLTHTQKGDFSIEGITGVDDLTPFGFSENTPLDVYYAEEGSEEDVWHYLGPAGTTIMTDRMGKYMMATSIKNDVIAPEILADLNDETGILHIRVNENIGLRVNTLNVLINGMKRDVTAINESNFEVYLSKEDMDYMLTLYVTINDLAGNQGSLFQIFNIDKDDPDGIKTVETEKDKTEIYLSKNMLKVKDAEPDVTFMLFSIKGDVITKGKTDDSGNAQIHLNHLTTGVYVVTLSNGKAKKFLIK